MRNNTAATADGSDGGIEGFFFFRVVVEELDALRLSRGRMR